MNSSKHKTLKPPHPWENTSRLLFSLMSVGFILGIFGGSFWHAESLLIFLIPLLLLILFSQVRKWLSLGLILALFVLGWSMSMQSFQERQDAYRFFESATKNFTKKVVIVWEVEKRLYKSDFSDTFRLKVDTIDTTSTQEWGYDIGILFEIPSNLTLRVWDCVRFEAKVTETIEFPLEKWSGYNWFHKTFGKTFVPLFSIVEKGEPWFFEKAESWWEKLFFEGFPRDIAGILLGMTIGNIELLSSSLKEAFNTSGISHILVVSGSNITFVLMLVSGIWKYIPLPTLIKRWGILLCVFLYGWLVGWDTAVIRAVCMGTLAYIALGHGKKTHTLSLLLFVGCIFLAFSPLSLLYDASFWLSFGATLSIILFAKRLSQWFERAHIPRFLSEIMGVSVVASLGTTPVLLFYFWTFSLGSILVNILIAPVLGWVLLWGTLYMTFAFLGETFLYFFGYLLYFPVKYIIFLGEFFALGWGVSLSEFWKTTLIFVGLAFLLSEVVAKKNLKSK